MYRNGFPIADRAPLNRHKNPYWIVLYNFLPQGEPHQIRNTDQFVSIKPGRIGEFIEAQRSYAASTSLPKGIIGGRIYRSLDG
jgi:hypothetical protein